MRPEKANRIIEQAFKRFYKNPATLHTFRTKAVRVALEQALEKSIRMDKECWQWLKDSGASVMPEYLEVDAYYQDATDQESIIDNLHYIGDRWFSPGRIKFLIRVANENFSR